MCDTVVVPTADGMLFAKNSDRDANEAQVLDWQPRRDHPAGSRVRATWVSIPQIARTHAVLLSRPFWMWGAEIGANEHGVVIGNEAVFTREPVEEVGLLGMDLLRLGLERGATAEQAVAVIRELLREHGQGGRCGLEDPRFRYHNSFIVADASAAFVLETARRESVVEVVRGPRSISNGLTIAGFAGKHRKWLETWACGSAGRRERTEALARQATGPADMMRILRDHGEDQSAPRYAWFNGTLPAPCMHGGGLVASSVTTGSWVAQLRRGDDARHWVTATAAPDLSLFKPVEVNGALDLGPSPSDRRDAQSLWWRHEELHRLALCDYARAAPLFLDERDAVEERWLAARPEPQAAFAEAETLRAGWLRRLNAARLEDRRPAWARRYWRKRERWARDGRHGEALCASLPH